MTTPTCPNCQKPLAADAPQGLCPACLMASVMHDTQPAAPPSAEDLQALAQHFPQLVIEELIGTGGMGRVYRAQQPHLNRTVALKVLTPERANDPEWLERFNREARALARLSHPHIVQVYDFGEAPMPYLLMEYVDGVNLRQAMQNGALTAREALAIVPKLCDALHYAHEHGVLHRDIKPENILIDTEGRVKVVDFGLAKLRDENALPFTLTQSGAKLGTLAYMAPEQIEKPSDVDHRADIYSLGVVFYEMLTGELPLGRFPTPSEASGVDPRLDGVVMRTLEKRREKRFDNASEMKSGIENASNEPLPATQLPRWDSNGYEYRSKARIGSWPLLHIAFNKDPQTGKAKRAQGIIAIGMHARGVVALGLFAYGLFAWGVVSFGLIATGVLCIGGLTSGVVSIGTVAAYGVVAVAPIALGVTTIGYIASGVVGIGKHTAGVSGAIDPLAAQIGDRWLMPMMRWSNGINAALLTTLMLVGAFGAWKASKRWSQVWLFLGLALIGPINYFTTKAVPSQTQNFASRLQKLEEENWLANRQAADERKQQRDARIKALTDDWVTKANRTDSTAVRDEAFQTILSAIQSNDYEKVDAGLFAVMRTSQVNVDRTKLRDAIRPLLDDTNLQISSHAISALIATNYEPVDADRILAMVPLCDYRLIHPLEWAMSTFSKRDYTGRYSAPMLSLLVRGIALAGTTDEDGNRFDSRETFNPLWGAQLSPEIEAKVIEWTKAHEMSASNSNVSYNAFYYALSTQANKSSASVKRILELAQHPDVTNIAGRCLWGLKGTVPDKKDQAEVASFVIKLLESRNDGYQWKQGLGLLEGYATTEHLSALEAFAAREALPSDQKEALARIISKIKAPTSAAAEPSANHVAKQNAQREDERAADAEQLTRKEVQQQVYAEASNWINRAARAKTPEELKVVIAEVEQMLNSENPKTLSVGLAAVSGMYQVPFDHTKFREHCRKQLSASSAEIRAQALRTLVTCDPDETDGDRLISMVPTCSLIEMHPLGWGLSRIAKGDLLGKYAQPIQDLLDRAIAACKERPGNILRSECRNLFGCIGGHVTPSLEKRLIEWSHIGDSSEGQMVYGSLGHTVFDQALSKLDGKTGATLARHLELAWHPNGEIASRAVWMLSGRIPDEADQNKAVTEIIKLLKVRTEAHLCAGGIEVIKHYARKSNLSALEELAASPSLPADHREKLDWVINNLKSNP